MTFALDELVRAHLIAQGVMTPERMTEAVMEALHCSRTEAREVNRRLFTDRKAGLRWDGKVVVR